MAFRGNQETKCDKTDEERPKKTPANLEDRLHVSGQLHRERLLQLAQPVGDLRHLLDFLEVVEQLEDVENRRQLPGDRRVIPLIHPLCLKTTEFRRWT